MCLKPPKACFGWSADMTFHTSSWCSGSELLITSSGLWSKCLPLKLLGSLGGVPRSCSQLDDERMLNCVFLHILQPSSIILVHVSTFLFALLNNCGLIIPPSPTLALQYPKGPIQFPKSQAFVYTPNTNNWDTKWIFHFPTYFDIVETHINLFLFSLTLSNYLDGKNVKQYFLITTLISFPELLLHFIT